MTRKRTKTLDERIEDVARHALDYLEQADPKLWEPAHWQAMTHLTKAMKQAAPPTGRNPALRPVSNDELFDALMTVQQETQH